MTRIKFFSAFDEIEFETELPEFKDMKPLNDAIEAAQLHYNEAYQVYLDVLSWEKKDETDVHKKINELINSGKTSVTSILGFIDLKFADKAKLFERGLAYILQQNEIQQKLIPVMDTAEKIVITVIVGPLGNEVWWSESLSITLRDFADEDIISLNKLSAFVGQMKQNRGKYSVTYEII